MLSMLDMRLGSLAASMAAGQGHVSGLSGPSVQLQGIARSVKGTYQTLEIMKKAVLGKPKGIKRHEGAHMPEVRFLAQQIVSHVPSKDYAGEAQAIFDFVYKHVRYTLDPRGLEWVQTPWWTLLVIGQGDCDDHTVAICALATALGHGCAFRVAKGDPKTRPNEFTHVWPVIGIKKRGRELWLPADTTEVGTGARLGIDPPGAEGLAKETMVVVPA